MDLVLLLMALIGHVFFWVAVVNRVHSMAKPVWAIAALTLAGFACMLLIPVGFALWFALAGPAIRDLADLCQVPLIVSVYLVVCWIAALVAVTWWGWRRVLQRTPVVVRADRSRSINLGGPVATEPSKDHPHHFLAHLPGNQILQLDVAERALNIPRLSPALDGLSIVHFSDLHFTGRIGKTYFLDVVELSNQLEPDLVAITGDLVDKSACIDWIPDTLSRLSSRCGSYFVLGNHDLQVDVDRLRRTLTGAGLVDLGGRWVEVPVYQETVVLAGSQLPWIPPAADMRAAPPHSGRGGPLRVLLSHSPDQVDWARVHHFDLMLAGHTHGGQISLPLIGPIFTPSRTGVKYASGVFHLPPTILHVTRGVSAQLPLRLNCPPEVARLVLHARSGDHG